MKKILLTAIIVMMATSLGLYAQERDTIQDEPKAKLELVWEKEIPGGIVDVSFDKVTLAPKIIIAGKSSHEIDCVYFFDSGGIVLRKIVPNKYDDYAEAKLSENGAIVATFEPDGIEYGLEAYKGNVKIFDSKGQLLKNFYVIGGVSWVSNDGDAVVSEYLSGDVTFRITKDSKSYEISYFRDDSWLNIPGEFFRAWGDYVIVGATKTANGFAGFRREQENLKFSGFLNIGNYLYWVDKNILYIVDEFGGIVQECRLNTSGSYSLTSSPGLQYLAVLQQKFRDVYLVDISTQQVNWKLDEEPVKWHPWKRINVADGGQLVIGEVTKSFYFLDPSRQITIRGELPDDAVIVSTIINSSGNKIVIITASGWMKCYSVILSVGGEK